MNFWITLIILLVVFLLIVPTFLVSVVLYLVLLVRTSKRKWTRKCSMPKDKEICEMFDIGMEWAEKYADRKKEVSVTSDGFKLCGEYFDFGFDKAAIIIAGRTESLLYGYYFAEPYRVSGYNILVIDNRAHGNSEGRISSLGFKEYRDLLAWSKMLNEELGNKKVWLHGICIGSSQAIFALTSENCPEYMQGMTSEGMYTCFYETLKNHIRDWRKPIFPTAQLFALYVRIFSGADIIHDGPYFRVNKLDKPILMLQSREDIFSLPEKAQVMFDLCSSKEKQLVYFDKGAHSHIKINNSEKYDKVIIDFLQKICHNDGK